MKAKKRIVFFSYLGFALAVLGGCIACLVLKDYGKLFFVAVPALFVYPIHLTFSKTPERFDFHVFRLIMVIILRWVLVILALLIPMLFWYFLGWVKENTHPIYILIPLFEVLFPYIFTLIMSIIDCLEKNDKKEEKDSSNK